MNRDDGECAVRWCHETAGHDGPHRRTLYDVNAVDVETARPAILQINIEGLSARTKALVVVTQTRQTALTWRQVDELRETLTAARRRYATP